MFSCRVKKWNKYTMKQDRNLVVTNLNIYNFKHKSKWSGSWSLHPIFPCHVRAHNVKTCLGLYGSA
jgi:hypothetical protein